MVRCGCGFMYFSQETKQNREVPLKKIDVNVAINGYVGHVTSTLTYEHKEKGPIEAVFTFPVDENSAVYKFEAEIEGRKIIAECQEKEQAKQTYDDAISEGRTAMLLEEHSEAGDMFKCTVGNVPPNTDAVVQLSYVQELQFAAEGAGVVQFVLPFVMVPRYRPADAGPIDLSGLKPQDVPYAMTFKTSISGSKVKAVTSESQQIKVEYRDTGAEVTLDKDFKFEKDLKLLIEYQDAFQPATFIQKGQADRDGILKQDVLMLNFMPELKESDFSNNHEFIFIIDRSGSMGGQKILDAAETLLLLLKSLPTDCYFNICSFGSRHDFLFKKSTEYSEESLNKAIQFQQTLNANYGGTEVLRPLEEIYKQKLIPTHTRQLLLLTDGAVSNTHQVISLVKKNNASARMFALGIGEGASTALVKGIARAGKGKAEFIYGKDRMQLKVMNILKQSMQNAVRNVTLDWSLPPEVKVTMVPEEIPPIFAGDKLLLYAIIKTTSSDLQGSVTLNGMVGDRPVTYELAMSRAAEMADSDSQPLHRLAAKAQIKLLEDREDADRDSRGWGAPAPEDQVKDQVTDPVFGTQSMKQFIVMLSTSANIASRYTSFVGIDKERREKIEGPLIRPRHEEVKELHSQLDTLDLSCMRMPLYSHRRAASGMNRHKYKKKRGSAPVNYASQPMMSACSGAALMGGPPPPPSRGGALASRKVTGTLSADTGPAPVRRDVMGIVQLQGFQGNWELNQSLAEVLGKNLDELKASTGDQDPDCWATVLALAWLQVNFSSNHEEWDMIGMKSRKWLTSRDLKGQTIDALLEKAKQLNLKL